MGIVLADYADRPDESGHRSRSRCRQARVRCDDADEKDRHRCHRGGAPRLRFASLTREVVSSTREIATNSLDGLAPAVQVASLTREIVSSTREIATNSLDGLAPAVQVASLTREIVSSTREIATNSRGS